MYLSPLAKWVVLTNGPRDWVQSQVETPKTQKKKKKKKKVLDASLLNTQH